MMDLWIYICINIFCGGPVSKKRANKARDIRQLYDVEWFAVEPSSLKWIVKSIVSDTHKHIHHTWHTVTDLPLLLSLFFLWNGSNAGYLYLCVERVACLLCNDQPLNKLNPGITFPQPSLERLHATASNIHLLTHCHGFYSCINPLLLRQKIQPFL